MSNITRLPHIHAIELVVVLEPNDEVIRGEENLKRLKETGKILLDASVAEKLWRSDTVPESWKELSGVFFWGTIFTTSSGRYVAFLYWNGRKWSFHYRSIDLLWSSDRPAACLAAEPSP